MTAFLGSHSQKAVMSFGAQRLAGQSLTPCGPLSGSAWPSAQPEEATLGPACTETAWGQRDMPPPGLRHLLPTPAHQASLG